MAFDLTLTDSRTDSELKNPYGTLTPGVPETKYFLTKDKFDRAVGRDFIKHANRVMERGEKFMVGLSHGRSPAGAYQYIIDHYDELIHPQDILYTFVNSPTGRQIDINDVIDARRFIKILFRTGPVSYTHLTLPTNREV